MLKKISKKTKVSSSIRPSVGIIFALSVALIISIIISVVSFTQLKTYESDIATKKLEVFDDLAESYIRDMDLIVNDQDANTYITGYGISDENDVFYITFDFVLDPMEGAHHGILYIEWDAEHGSFGHAYSYHDDASYHPDGIYYRIVEQFKMDRKLKIHGVYKHFKGGLYLVEDIIYHSETGEKMVAYRALYGDNKLWCRPYDMFMEEIEPGKYRFEEVKG